LDLKRGRGEEGWKKGSKGAGERTQKEHLWAANLKDRLCELRSVRTDGTRKRKRRKKKKRKECA